MRKFVCDECGKEEEGFSNKLSKTEVWVESTGESTDTYEVKVTVSKRSYHGGEPLDLCSACVLEVVQRAFSAEGLREAKEIDEWRTRQYMGTLV